MRDIRLAKIESDIWGFVRDSYPHMVVRAEYWDQDPSRIALFFIDERFRDLYRRQRYHYLVHMIPKEYFDSTLADAGWFALTPDESPDSVDDPDEEFIASITPDVIGSLQECQFFAALDEVFLPKGSTVKATNMFGGLPAREARTKALRL